MAGSKTRFGFVGNGGEPPDDDEPRAARTVIGHDIHLQMPAGFAPPRPPGSPTPLPPVPFVRPPLPSVPVMAPLPEQITESVRARRTNRPRKSRLARFLGHWTKSGRFESSSRMDNSSRMDDVSDDDLEVPRDTTGRNVLLVLIVALLTFLVTFALVKMRQRYASTRPPSSQLVVETRLDRQPGPPSPTPPMPASAHPTGQAPPAAGSPPAPPRSSPPVLAPTPAAAAATARRIPGLDTTPKADPHPRKPQRPVSYAAEPPDHLKGELLPISP